MAIFNGTEADDVLPPVGFDNSGDDTFNGFGGNDSLDGGFGEDVMNGGAGNDVINGGADNDTLNGGSGADQLDGGIGSRDVATYADAAGAVGVNLVTGTASDGDTLIGIEYVTGSAFGDTLTGDIRDNQLLGLAGNDTIVAGGGNDHVEGGAGNDQLSGGDGNDVLTGGAGADTFDGGAGNDVLIYYGGASGVTINLTTGICSGGDAAGDVILGGIETVYGTNFADNLTGSNGNDFLDGRNGDDILFGGAGDDQLFTSQDSGLMRGGDGADILKGYSVSYDDSSVGVVLELFQDPSDFPSRGVGHGGTAEGDTTYSLIFHGSAFSDRFVINNYVKADIYSGDGDDIIEVGRPGLGGEREVYGGSDNDTFIIFMDYRGEDLPVAPSTFDGGDGFDICDFSTAELPIIFNVATGLSGDVFPNYYLSIEGAVGSSMADRLTGDDQINLLAGGNGDDTLNGGGGSDVLRGDGGADLLRGDAGGDTLDGGAGTDTASYYASASGVGVNLTTGKSSDGDTLISIEVVNGSNFADSLTGNAASNTLRGYDGNDLLKGGPGGDTLDGGNGVDTVSYADAAGGIGLNLTTGKSSDGDTLIAVENLTGSAYGDSLTGNAGANVLTGGGGKDALAGGAGADSFRYTAIGDSGIGAASRDVIADFSHAQHDRIDLSAIDARGNVAGDQAFTFLGTGAFTGVSGQLHYWHEGSQTIVSGDINGDKVADFNIALQGTLTLVAGDFVL